MISDRKMEIPSRLHFVGICGIGMSALAQFLRHLNCEISGSDRSLDSPENRLFTEAFRAQGIELFPQDGSFAKFAGKKPDGIIYSSAVEDGNPDFAIAPEIPRIHRASALSSAIRSAGDRISVAVAGSAGKTSVSACLSETLAKLGEDPLCICGGVVNSFNESGRAGNFRPGSGPFVVYEADESDKSLLEYSPDYSIILNIGTDHYPKEELAALFSDFARKTRRGIVCEAEALSMLDPQSLQGKNVAVFGTGSSRRSGAGIYVSEYRISDKIPFARLESDSPNFCADLKLSSPGEHNALNAAATLSFCRMLELDPRRSMEAVSNFGGVWRRFDYAGSLPCGAKVFDDYAHNVEKICNCIRSAAGIADGKLICIFQPHGFKPLGFMKDALLAELELTLRKNDLFIFLPVFYAGGSSSFKPSSSEIVEFYQAKGTKNYLNAPDRASAEEIVSKNASSGDIVLILGARDNSLSSYAKKIAN